MKKILCIVTSVILAGWHDPLAAQKVVPLIGLDYNLNNGWGGPRLNQLNLHAGIVCKKMLFLEVHEGFNNLARSAEFPRFHYWTTSFSATVRFVPAFKLSPVLCITAGFGSPYKGDSAYVEANTKFINLKNTPYCNGVFGKVSGFGSIQVGGDLAMERWHLWLVGGLNDVSMHKILFNPSGGLIIYKQLGWIASVGVSYELRFGKQ